MRVQHISQARFGGFFSGLRLGLIALTIGVLMSPAQAQEQVDLTIPQAREVARQALFADDPALALQIAESILAKQPDDRTALLIVAAAAPRLGDPAKGRIAGTQAWSLAANDAQRYEAARLTALAAANEERFTLSTFWLRRALTVVPNAAERTRTLQDARAVSRANPWSSSLSFSLAPSNNVNGGAEEEVLRIEGENNGGRIPDSGLALSGWRGSLGVGVQYRFQESPQSQSVVALSYQGARVRITEDTEVLDESLRTDTGQLTLRHVRALENGTIGIDLSYANFDYRNFNSATDSLDVESYDTARIGVQRQLSVADQTTVSFAASRERLRYSLEALGEIYRTNLNFGVSHVLGNGDRVGASLGIVQGAGENGNLVSNDRTVSVSYALAEPLGPVSLAAVAGFSVRNFPDFRVFEPPFSFVPLDGGRDDLRGFANLNIGFPNVSYAGFSPGIRLDAARTRSNVSRYDQTLFTAGFTLTSSF